MSKEIKKAYHQAGLPVTAGAPKGGKGIHTLAGHKCVIDYLRKGKSRDEAWKRCMGALGQLAIKPSHRRTPASQTASTSD